MKALIIAAAFFVAAIAVEASGQEKAPDAQVQVEVAPDAKAAPADAKPVAEVKAPKPAPAPLPVIMFERAAVPVSVRVLRIDGSVDCRVPEPGVIACTAARTRPAPAPAKK